jgi:hypothetical protein
MWATANWVSPSPMGQPARRGPLVRWSDPLAPTSGRMVPSSSKFHAAV